MLEWRCFSAAKLCVLISFSCPFSLFSFSFCFCTRWCPNLRRLDGSDRLPSQWKKNYSQVKPVSKVEILQFAGALQATGATYADAHNCQPIAHVLWEGASAQEHIHPQDTIKLQTSSVHLQFNSLGIREKDMWVLLSVIFTYPNYSPLPSLWLLGLFC